MNALLITTFMLHAGNFPLHVTNVEQFTTYDACVVARDTSNAKVIKTMGWGIPSAPTVAYHNAECYKIPENKA
jgi:hypothetical protein